MDAKDGYKTGYSNPKCKNRDNNDCAKGEVNKHGLCDNCDYALRVVKADEYDKIFFLLRHFDANRYAEQYREDKNALVKFAIVVIAIIAILTIVLKLII